MKLAVVGSRDFNDKKVIFDKLDQLNNQYKIEMIISGGAKGVDSISIEWAKKNNIKFDEKIPDWDTPVEGVPMKINKFGKPYNPIAGKLRNTLIVNDCSHLIAFWDGFSGGTKDSIDKAKKQDKVLEIVYVKKIHR